MGGSAKNDCFFGGVKKFVCHGLGRESLCRDLIFLQNFQGEGMYAEGAHTCGFDLAAFKPFSRDGFCERASTGIPRADKKKFVVFLNAHEDAKYSRGPVCAEGAKA